MGVWDVLLSLSLRRRVRQGALLLRHTDGRVERFGEPGVPPASIVRLHGRRIARSLVVNPSVALGEAYVSGRLTLEDDNLRGLLEVLHVNLARRRHVRERWWVPPVRRVRRRRSELNPPERARQNVSHHYDLSDTLFKRFLDPDLQYSCAYFTEPGQSLEAAQKAKQRHIAAKLLLEPGHRVLDMGCGWGGLALYLASEHGARVTGITLSAPQCRKARERAVASNPAIRPTFLQEDYRRVGGTFDRIVSVGMFEHVGKPHFGEFFETVRNRLSDDGVALIHTIGRAHGPAATDPWIAKHIFPGGAIPALSEIVPAVERAGLILTDLEVWRLHYARTLEAWQQNFHANRQTIGSVHGERFCRMWTYYLAASEMAFRHGGLVVFQLQLARRQDAVPMTREYLARQVVPAEEMAHTA